MYWITWSTRPLILQQDWCEFACGSEYQFCVEADVQLFGYSK